MKFEQYILTPVREAIRNYAKCPAFFINGEYCTYTQFAERISAIRGVVRAAILSE